MASPRFQDTGIGELGEMPWGSHLCLFYQTATDLVDVIVPYFAAGLEANELCVWLPSDPRWEAQVREGLRQVVPDFQQRLKAGQLDFIDAGKFYRANGVFDAAAVMRQWEELAARIHAQGFTALRGSGDVSWLERADWDRFKEYETRLHAYLHGRQMLVLCTYPLAAASATDILDTVRTHHLVVARRAGTWEMVETSALKQTKAQIKATNEELERRVQERTRQLAEAIEAKFAAVLEERTRLAREIHDTLLQGVTGIALQLRAILPRLSRAPPTATSAIKRIVELAEGSVREAREATWDMRSPPAGPRDLAAHLRDMLRRTAGTLTFHFHVNGEPRPLEATVEDTILRVGREAVLNTVRHARAASVTVTLDYGPRQVRLRVADDGAGFNVETASETYSGLWGLLGMRERASRIGGSLVIESHEGRGTVVELGVPARPEARPKRVSPAPPPDPTRAPADSPSPSPSPAPAPAPAPARKR